ncbi:MAG: portal protein [Pseudomonadota bacterium]
MSETVETLLARFSAMATERALIEPFYHTASLFFDPLQARHWSRSAQSRQGPNWNGDLFSGAGIASTTRLTNFLIGNGTPATADWLKLQDGELQNDAEAAQYWADATRVVAKQLRGDTMHGGSFYIAKRLEYRQMAISYGVTAVYEQELDGVMTGRVIHEHVPSHGFFYQLDPFGRMLTGAYLRSMTDEQVRTMIGRDRPNSENGEMAAAKSSDRHEILQIVRMNTAGREIPRDPTEFPYVEYWIDRREKKILRVKGYFGQPFHVIGWNQVPQSNYFVGPAYDALPDMASAAAARKSQILAMEFVATPPLLGGNKIEGAGRTLRPRRITWGAMNAEGRQMVVPLQSGANPGPMFQQVQDDEARVRTMMYNDELLTQRRPNMTATEAQIMANERAAMVAPFAITTIPAIRGQVARHVEIGYRAGTLPAPPQRVIEDGVFDAEVVGPLALAARQSQVGSLMSTFELAAFVEQSPTQRLDKDEAIRLIAHQHGHESVLRDLAEVKEEMRQQAAMQSQAMQAEVDKMESETVKNVAEVAA